MKGYCTKTDLENYTLRTIDVSFNSQITAWIEQIEKYIDRYTGRNFLGDTTSSEKVYDGNNSQTLLVDDYVTLTKVEVNDVEIPTVSIYSYPVNTEQKYKIHLDGYIFTYGHQNITITAKWGYSSSVPADIRLAATILLAGIIAYADSAGKQKKSESIGSYNVSYESDKGWQDFSHAKDILDSYRRLTF